jgi:hypothetical protein
MMIDEANAEIHPPIRDRWFSFGSIKYKNGYRTEKLLTEEQFAKMMAKKL